MTRTRQLNLRVTEEERRWYDEYRAAGMSVEQAVGAILTARQMKEGPAVVVMPPLKVVAETPVLEEPAVPQLAKIRSGLCPHRVPRGTFCKRCAGEAA